MSPSYSTPYLKQHLMKARKQELCSDDSVIFIFFFSGVEVTDIVCNINANIPVVMNTPLNPITANTIKEDVSGYFHLDLQIFTNGEAGGVTGSYLWKIKVFLSPDHDGATETVAQYVQTGVFGGNWEDTGGFWLKHIKASWQYVIWTWRIDRWSLLYYQTFCLNKEKFIHIALGTHCWQTYVPILSKPWQKQGFL